MDTIHVGKKLVDLCREGKFREAMEALYSPDIVSIEAGAGPNMPARVDGIDAVRKKADWWEQNHEVHSVDVNGPFPNGDQFIVRFMLDVTAKSGPMAGQRMVLDEAGLYTVTDGKITQEEFFYTMG